MTLLPVRVAGCRRAVPRHLTREPPRQVSARRHNGRCIYVGARGLLPFDVEIVAQQSCGIRPVGPGHRGYIASDRFAPQVVTDFGSCSPDIVGCVPGSELGTIELHPTGSDVQESCHDDAGIGDASTPIRSAVAERYGLRQADRWSSRPVPSRPQDRPRSRPYRTVRWEEIATGSGDEQAVARERKRPSPEDNFRVVVRRERLVNGVRLHVETAPRAVEETAHREQPILGAAGHQVERRSPAEHDSVVRGSQPLDAKLLRRKKIPRP